MPHDKFGRKIDRGDIVKVEVYDQSLPPAGEVPDGVPVGPRKVVGVVRYITPSDTCSGQLRVMSDVGEVMPYFNAKDAEIVLKADGTEPNRETV